MSPLKKFKMYTEKDQTKIYSELVCFCSELVVAGSIQKTRLIVVGEKA